MKRRQFFKRSAAAAATLAIAPSVIAQSVLAVEPAISKITPSDLWPRVGDMVYLDDSSQWWLVKAIVDDRMELECVTNDPFAWRKRTANRFAKCKVMRDVGFSV